MSRIEPLTEEPQDELYRQLLRHAEEKGTPDARMVKVYGRTELGAQWLAFCHEAFYGGILPHRLKELIRIRMSVAEECGYCSSLRSKQAQEEGLTEDVVMEMLDLDASTRLTEQEKAAVRYADRYRRDDVDADDAFEELRKHFSDEEIIELGVLCGTLDGGGKFAKSLQVLSWSEACEIRATLTEMRAAQAEQEPAAVG